MTLIERLAEQAYRLLCDLADAQGTLPTKFHIDRNGKQVIAASVSERMIPGAVSYYTAVAHLRRYAFVAENVGKSPHSMLDAGCGVGYGLSMLMPQEGLGIDIACEALAWAAAAFPQKKLRWMRASVEEAAPGRVYDVVTCFEVIEHLGDHVSLMDVLTSALAPNGSLFVSIPNPRFHGTDKNHYHKRDYCHDAVIALFEEYFERVEWFHQDDDAKELVRRFVVKPGVSSANQFWLAKCSGPRVHRKRRPKASIVIPVFNNWEYTQKALHSLKQNTPGKLDWELILVDNASSDVTGEHLRALPMPAVVRSNTKNLGFAKACNQGALLARGKYLVFLNNDTEVHQGWLESLLEELEANPDTGLVGGRLLYPDGTVQHAGVAIGRDQIPFHIHQGVHANDPLVLKRRNFPVLTAACAAVRCAEFLDMGGFDEAFVNGHEDIDLCIRYRRSGKQCIYRPDCTVTHHESTSEGRMASRKQNLMRTFAKSRYDLIQDDFAYSFSLESMRPADRPLRIAVKTGVPLRDAKGWGDIYYAESLAKALSRAGHYCVIHYLSEWGSEDTDIDVVIHIKGLSQYFPKPWNINIMWMINHPSLHTNEELAQYDAVCAASVPHAAKLAKELSIPVIHLLQATDPEHFTPRPYVKKNYDLIFVGNNDGIDRLEMRAVIRNLLPAEYSLAVIGRGWENLLPAGVLTDTFVDWEKLPDVYASAKIVLSDHQPEMAANGFINNRVYDALACGCIVVSDPVKGMEDILDVPQCGSRSTLHKTIAGILKEEKIAGEKAAALRAEVLAKHTFTDRVKKLEKLIGQLQEESGLSARIGQARRRIADSAYRQSGPLVSVLMSTYNRRRYLARALQSIIAQTYTDWEIWLVCDGGERVDDIVDSLADARIHLVHLENNKGKGYAVNLAFSKSAGEYIAYLDDDDDWLPDHLERLMLAVREIPGVSLAYSDVELVTLQDDGENGFMEVERELRYQRQVTLGELMEFNQINGVSVLHRRDLFVQAGRFDEKLRVLIDFDMWHRLAALTYPYHVSRITAEHFIRIAPGGSEQITSLAKRDPLAYRKQRIRIMAKRLPLPADSPFHKIQQQLLRKSLFEYYVVLCQETYKKGYRHKSDKLLRFADANKVDSIEGMRGLALCYMERKEYTSAYKIFATYIFDSENTITDMMFAYFASLEASLLEEAEKSRKAIESIKDQLNDNARTLYEEYSARLLEKTKKVMK
ncbi:hypothetical protein FACS1894206_03630 [Deltaproteobacteria bacterium]|nr:hypothetical protein FACS1894206_03630 [Deltaproteobacteria bacterium]